MTVQRKRKDDKGPRRYKTILHWIGGIFIGFHLSKMFPEEERLIGVVDLGIDWLFTTLQAIGGLAALGSFLVIILPFAKWIIERRKKSN